MEIIETGHVKKGFFSYFTQATISIFVICFLLLTIIVGWVQTRYTFQIVEPAEVSDQYDTAVVFGAGLRARGTPGLFLEDRLQTAVNLFHAGQVEKLLLSGDNTSPNHNEVQAMKNFVLDNGVPEENLILDHSGLNTYDTCYRAKHVFNLNNAVLVTQKYHLHRALYVCNTIGLNSVGVDASLHDYPGQLKLNFREKVASLVDWFEVHIMRHQAQIMD
ncbi:hypothetical protein COT97_04660 [Candidatus Falkowbacteria bacterium CG10_big_fil_rev_8_21_14_0_10_39_11]|uniref:DUF218 domain-containing protein n=1 Tax=Candidatus Falkowbacteria bacterium CG10_big_fil_rev_8_21_14_0_10_39_11 TaxID=1974565 RepID=A0A2H0V3Z4_9BACT|nr:MAG: hypothetical protein COT97_04660 [Candidatus Falkowbacteria bacterium CG10_big_fil_rev_8_21_14_0_10_39_11]